jgi:RNA recognition motif-containing protein
MNNRVFVGNLKYQVTDDELRLVFAEVGPVSNLEIVRDDRGRARFAFVEMVNDSDAENAIGALDGFDMHGRAIHCEPAKSPARQADRNRQGPAPAPK